MFKNLYSLNVFYCNIKGINNKELTKICEEASTKKSISKKVQIGYTDVTVDATNK